jgi:hypothetical protein
MQKVSSQAIQKEHQTDQCNVCDWANLCHYKSAEIYFPGFYDLGENLFLVNAYLALMR